MTFRTGLRRTSAPLLAGSLLAFAPLADAQIRPPIGDVNPDQLCATQQAVGFRSPPLPPVAWRTSCEHATLVRPTPTPTRQSFFNYVTVAGCPSLVLRGECLSPTWQASACGRKTIEVGGCAPWSQSMAQAFVLQVQDQRAHNQLRENLIGHGGVSASPSFAGLDLGVSGTDLASPLRPAGAALLRYFAVQFPGASYREYVDRLRAESAAGNESVVSARLAQWEANGNRMDSCAEYVHERYYDASRIELLSLRTGLSGRALFDALMGPASTPDAVATRQICGPSPNLRARDQLDTFGPTLGGRTNYAPNAFKTDFLRQANAVDEARRLGLPELADELESLFGDIDASGAAPLTWGWLAGRARTLRTLPRYASAEVAPDGDPSHACGGERLLGYTDDELDALYELQQRYVSLLRQIRALDLDAEVELVNTEIGTPWFDEIVSPEAGLPTLQRIAQVETEVDVPILTTLAFNPEVVIPVTPPRRLDGLRLLRGGARGALLFELRGVLREAQRAGCFEGGVTPCDWSPKLFLELAQNAYKTEQEAAYAECVRYVENPNDFSARATFAALTSDRIVSATRSPHSASWYARFAIKCGPLNSDCPSSPPTVESTRQWTRSGGDMAATTNTMATHDDPAPSDASTRFFTLSRRFDQVVADLTRLQASSLIAGLAPDLVQNGSVRPPSYNRQTSESLGNDYLSLSYRTGASMVMARASGGAGFVQLGPNGNVPYDVTGRAFIAAGVKAFGIGSGDNLVSYQTVVSSDLNGTHAHGTSTTVTIAGITQEVPAVGGLATQTYPIASGEGRFALLGIPIVVRFSQTASISAPSSWTDGDDVMRRTVTPSVSSSARGTAGIDLFLAEAGVGGQIELLTASVPMVIDVSRSAQTLSFNSDASLTLSALAGRVFVYAEVGWGPLSESAERDVISWPGTHTSFPIMHARYDLPIETLRQIWQ